MISPVLFEDPRSRSLLARLQQLAPSEATVLITGETGTGKEVVARFLHAHSPRRDGPFVALNCGTLSETLIESELFGHERGAFTGASTAKEGWFEAARGGTLFLDEIGDLPLKMQVKLLRVLQEREVIRLGARHAVPVDARLLVATNVHLGEAVLAHHFREDLYYRLAVATVEVPPLRERPGDIMPLARHFAAHYAQRSARKILGFTGEAEARLREHVWPGNVRELENVVHHALLVAAGAAIGAGDLRLVGRAGVEDVDGDTGGRTVSRPGPTPVDALQAALAMLCENGPPDLYQTVEAVLMRAAYGHCEQNQVQTAKLLGVSRAVARKRLISHGLLVVQRPSPAPTFVPTSHRPPAPTKAGAVRIGFQKFGILALLKAKGTFERRLAHDGLAATVDWREFPAGLPLVEALQEDAVDLGVVGEVPPLIAQAAGAGLLYLAAEPPAPQAEALLVHRESELRSVRDLRGRTIAVARGANAEYMVLRALEEAALTEKDVQLAYVPPAEARASFERREVEVWAIWNPHLAMAVEKLGARVLRNAEGLAANHALYMGRRAFVRDHEAITLAFLDEVRTLGVWANEHPAAAAEALGRELGISRHAVSAALGDVRHGARPLDTSVIAGQQRVADSLHAYGLLPSRLAVTEAVWSTPGWRLPEWTALAG